MEIRKRERILFIITIVCFGLLLADKIVLTPLLHLWQSRSARIVELNKSLNDGQFLIQRADAIRERDAEMKERSLPTNVSLAENQVLSAVNRWSSKSNLALTSIKPRWDRSEDEYTVLEIGAFGIGSMKSLSRFLYELEKDPLAIRLESVGIAARDDRGRDLSLAVQFTALVLPDSANSGADLNPSASIPEFDEYSVIYENNIFDPRRRPNQPETESKPTEKPEEREPAQKVSLIGVLVRPERSLAFFTGSGAESAPYEVGRTVNGLEVASIDTNAVTLKRDEAEYRLPVGSSLEKKPDGDWEVIQGIVATGSWGESREDSESDTPDESSNDSGNSPADDIMKRLMERRQKELQ